MGGGEEKTGGIVAHFSVLRYRSIIKRLLQTNINGAYLSHGSEMLSKLYRVWKGKIGLISYVMQSYMESPTAWGVCVCW